MAYTLDDYQEACRLGRDRTVLLGNTPWDLLRDAERRRVHMLRAIKIREELGIPGEIGSGWTGDPASHEERDDDKEELARIEGEIAQLKAQLGLRA